MVFPFNGQEGLFQLLDSFVLSAKEIRSFSHNIAPIKITLTVQFAQCVDLVLRQKHVFQSDENGQKKRPDKRPRNEAFVRHVK